MRLVAKGSLAALLALGVAAFAVWLAFRHPYDRKYFTPEMQQKYQTVESVLEAFRQGWKQDSRAHDELLREIYGYDLFKGLDQPLPRSSEDAIKPVKSITYSTDGKLAFVLGENFGWFFIWKGNRWVFYPETPWLPLIELIHGTK